nr:hypothetical protein [uncultured Rhodopila sp.]
MARPLRPLLSRDLGIILHEEKLRERGPRIMIEALEGTDETSPARA